MNFREYFEEINKKIQSTTVSSSNRQLKGSFEENLAVTADFIALQISHFNSKVMLIGNGGSAAIASHGAIDFLNSVRVKAMTFLDPSVITCISNDYGYENLFSRQIEMFAESGDVLIAISSSGSSKNILNAVLAAKGRNCVVVTLSGFEPQNPLRQLGEFNLYIPSFEYGIVEVCHQIIMHSFTDYIRLRLKEKEQIQNVHRSGVKICTLEVGVHPDKKPFYPLV
jgi:D-sedoheptulose 7-phosphate isomerase